MRVIGHDPGKGGALALVEGPALLRVEDIPVVDGKVAVHLLASWWGLGAIAAFATEKVHSMPGQGVRSMFAFGQADGRVTGAVGRDYRIIEVRPAEWKKTFKISGDTKVQKDKAVRLAIERWPAMADCFVGPRGGPLHGRAEAALIAEHVRLALERGDL